MKNIYKNGCEMIAVMLVMLGLVGAVRADEMMTITAQGYTNAYDGVAHAVSVRVLDDAASETPPQVLFSLTEEGPYQPYGEAFMFKDVINTSVWYCVGSPGYYPITNKVGVLITPVPLTITANNPDAIYNGQPAVDAGVTYSGFVNGENENTEGVLSGSLSYAYGDYGTTYATGTYAVTPSGLTAQNYEITYVAGTLEVKPFEPEDALNPATMRLDTRTGVRPMADVETLTYSPLWDGDADATVTVSVEGLYQAERTLVNGAGDEGTVALAAEGTQIYTVRHTTYTNGVAGEVLTAKFATFDAATEIVAQGYTNVYDGVTHEVSVTVPGMDAAAMPTLVRYALAEEGPYLAPGERFTFKDVINTSVWYCVGSPDYYPITNKIGVLITPAPLTITANTVDAIYNGQAAAHAGVTYSGFVSGENENTEGVFIGSLAYAYGDYGTTYATGTYAVTPSGLTAQNYEITYVAGSIEVKPFEPEDASNEATMRLDTRTGVRETTGAEMLAYSALWSGDETATVKVTADGVDLTANALSGEGVLAWSGNGVHIYSLAHTTYTNGVAGEVLSARFATFSMDDIVAHGYTNVYDGAAHTVSVSAPGDDDPAVTQVRYSLTEEGPYLPYGETFTFKDVINTSVWYCVGSPGNYPVTNKIGVLITPAPLTITANAADAIYNGQAAAHGGVTYSGFVNGENENTEGVLSGSLSYAYGDYGTTYATGTYAVTPSGLTAQNYEITYVAGSIEVKPFEPEDDSNEASMRLDTRTGVRETTGTEMLAYSALWSGDADAKVTVSVEGLYQAERTLVNGTGDEGTVALAAEGTQIYTLHHTTYTNGVAGAVLTAKFATFDPTTEIVAPGYTNVYDGVPHTVSVTVPGMDAATNPTLIRYALSEEGPYLAPGERFTFKDVINTSVWYCVGSPDYYPITNKIGVLITPAPLTITANNPDAIYNGQAATHGGVTYSGFVNGENENTEGVFSGSLSYAFGDYGTTYATGTYAVTPSGLNAQNYEITYVAGALEVKPFEPEDASNEATMRLDTRTGVRQSEGLETIVYSPLWSGDKDATVDVTLEGYYTGEQTIVDGASGEGTMTWEENQIGVYTFTHTTYTNGAVSEVLSAKFELVAGSWFTTNIVGAVSGATWTNSDSIPWVVTSENPVAAHSGGISHSGSTTLTLTVNGGGTLTYERKVSSENNYDWLTVTADGTQVEKISGVQDWAEKSYTVTGDGEHLFKWTYSKDGSASSNDDRAYIRNVVWTPDIPPMTNVVAKVQATGYEGVYDGKAHGVTVTTSVPGSVVRYGFSENGPFDLTEAPSYTEVTNVVVWYQVEHMRYPTLIGSVSVIIEAGAPTIAEDSDADVSGDAATGFLVKPSEGKTTIEVIIPNGVDASKVTVEVSTLVTKVKLNGAQVKIVKSGHNITDYVNIPAADTSGVIDLTKAEVKAEIVKEAMDPKNGAKFEVKASEPSLTTAPTKPGLTYTLREGAELNAMSDGDTKIGDGSAWTPAITVKGGKSGFYTIRVTK